ncbi:hypothetical protein BN10_440008 [Phycicoccus elongatus Lp2]|uniref:Response regulatory domain-containing protein n=3 Tax=Phycicoccus elongatus TaxID=101689 RepID=N0E2E3_9MICO|nr:hypothetical protein BN10_440008 [Phycicoccus elongatus Lp2]
MNSTSASPRLTRIDGSPVRVLVVDDEANLTELLSMALRYEGWEVQAAGTGLKAVRAAKEFQPDAVVLDMMLPDFDGLEVMRRMRADNSTVPVLFLTAKDAVEDRVAGLTAGGDDYVTKPFSLEEVVARLRALMRRTVEVAVQRHQVHRALPRDPRDLVLRFRLRRQRPARQEVLRPAHRLRHGPRRGLDGRAHAHPQAHLAGGEEALHRRRLPVGLWQDEPGDDRPDPRGLGGRDGRRRHRLAALRQGRSPVCREPRVRSLRRRPRHRRRDQPQRHAHRREGQLDLHQRRADRRR